MQLQVGMVVCATAGKEKDSFYVVTQLDGNASYRNYIIDAMFRLDGTALEEGGNYEIL